MMLAPLSRESPFATAAKAVAALESEFGRPALLPIRAGIARIAGIIGPRQIVGRPRRALSLVGGWREIKPATVEDFEACRLGQGRIAM
jgi:hypothetical protein